MSVKEYLKAGENLIAQFEDVDVQETFCCKYCTFETSNVEDLDEHIITHEEAILEDNGEEETEATISNGDMTSTLSNSVSPTPLKDSKEPKNQAKAYILSNKSPSKTTTQLLPAFYQQYADKEDKKVFVCPYCGYQTMKYLDLNRHLKDHSEPIYTCSECPYTCKRKHDINKHLRVHCENEPIFKCNKCPYGTYRKDYLTKHILCHGNHVESEGSVFKCDHCQYATIRKEHLTRHLLSHENNSTAIEPTFKCDSCPYKTKRKDHFTRHVLCHDVKHSEPMFKCESCPYGTHRKDHLIKHFRRHGNEVVYPKSDFVYSCTECGYTSRRLSDLHRHAVLHCDISVKGVFKCTKCDYASAAGNPFAKHVLSLCKVREMPAPIFPNEDQNNIETLRLGLDTGNIVSVKVLENENVKSSKLKRKTPLETHCTSSKKTNLESCEQSEPRNIDKESENCKVVVLTGFERTK